MPSGASLRAYEIAAMSKGGRSGHGSAITIVQGTSLTGLR